MKKFIILTVTAILMLLALVGCGCQDEIEYCDGNHVEEIMPSKAPTCQESGLTEGKKCAICDDIIVAQEVVQKLSHVYNDTYKCQVCGETAKESQGLNFELDATTNTYTFTGIGTCKDEDLVIPLTYEGLPVTKIKSYSLYNCISIKTLTLSKNITEIEDYSLCSCTFLVDITVSTKNTAYKGVDGSLYTKDGKVLMQYALGRDATSFEIPNGVEKIGACAFSSAQSLEKIVLANTVKTIGISAFVNCHSLSLISLNNVEKIDDNAFYGCSSLENITIPKGVTEMGAWAFYGCDSIIIECKAESKPDGWDDTWNAGNRPVIWAE
ncbi:MAG: leucine-rich repeat domain-containing protein [Clostridia bacterium]|nr:leucine-rich repeat domain-containing protein [Clostridia bacterium]